MLSLVMRAFFAPAPSPSIAPFADGARRPYHKTARGVGATIWDQERARDICREHVIERLGDASGILVVDETGFLKKGTHSVGVARQYSGTAGRAENCQVGVFLRYASAKGHALIDRRLYSTDVERREAACIPDEVAFAAKPKIAIEMVAAALDAGVPCAWVLGDPLYASDKTLRVNLEERDQLYVLAVRGNEKLSMGDFHTYTAEQLAVDLAPTTEMLATLHGGGHHAWRILAAAASNSWIESTIPRTRHGAMQISCCCSIASRSSITRLTQALTSREAGLLWALMASV
jgi:hypothetical protein